MRLTDLNLNDLNFANVSTDVQSPLFLSPEKCIADDAKQWSKILDMSIAMDTSDNYSF
jgi:hypothetical protein